jgi:hydrogenase maturation protease
MNVLVAGVGNVLLGDDGFGVEVVQRLRSRALPACVRLADFGIRGRDLAYALADYDAAVLVDLVSRGGPPGTLYVLEPRIAPDAAVDLGPHGLHPARALALAQTLGAAVATVRIVGCEPGPIDLEDLVMGLSPPVAAAVAPACAMVESLVASLLDSPVPSSASPRLGVARA